MSLATIIGMKWPDIRSMLAIIMTIGLFGIFYFLLNYEVPGGNRDTVNVLLGIIGSSGFSAVIQFYFGSSKGSEKKDEIMGRIAEAPPTYSLPQPGPSGVTITTEPEGINSRPVVPPSQGAV